MARLLAIAIASLSAAGCATAGRDFRCPAAGGAPWREIATDHLVVRTDLEAGDAAALVARLERQRAAIASVLPAAAGPPPGRVEVVAFRTREEYAPFAPPGADAYYVRSAGGPPRVVLPGDGTRRSLALVAHEMTHHLLACEFQRLPRWLAEGLAVYMESLSDDGGSGELVLGRPQPDRLARAIWNPAPAAEVLAWRGLPRPGSQSLYATSWALVHLLGHRRPEAFAALQARLARGEDPELAWRAELPEWDPARPGATAALDRALRAYVHGDIEATTRPAPARPEIVRVEQVMPSAEVHALRLALWRYGPGKRAAALAAEVAEALREDPDHPVALEVEAEIEGVDPRPLARRAARVHPDDPRAWTFLAGALGSEGEAAEREAAYRRAAALAPDNAAALRNLAADLLRAGRSGEGLPFARRAAAAAPWSTPVLETYAEVLADLGRCPEALAVQQRAVDVLPDGTDAGAFRAARDRLAAYADRCRVALSPGSPPSPSP